MVASKIVSQSNWTSQLSQALSQSSSSASGEYMRKLSHCLLASLFGFIFLLTIFTEGSCVSYYTICQNSYTVGRKCTGVEVFLGSSPLVDDLTTEKLLERFNQTIGYALLRGINRANRKLTEIGDDNSEPGLAC